MGNFIGRKEELEALQELYNKKGFHMAVLFGRRRVGKTTLVNKFIELNKCYQYLCNELFQKLKLNQNTL